MKKFKFFMMALAVIAFAGTFAACGGDDDDPQGGNDPKPVSAKVSYNLYVSEQLADIVDVEAAYTTITGQAATAALSQQKVTVNGKEYRVVPIAWDFQPIPFAEKINYKFSIKANADIPSTITVGVGTTAAIEVKYSDNSMRPFASQLSIGSSTIKSDKLAEYIESINKRYAERSFSVNDKGELE